MLDLLFSPTVSTTHHCVSFACNHILLFEGEKTKRSIGNRAAFLVDVLCLARLTARQQARRSARRCWTWRSTPLPETSYVLAALGRYPFPRLQVVHAARLCPS